MKLSRAVALSIVVFSAVALLSIVGSPYLITFGLVLLIGLILAQSWDWVGGLAGYVNLGHFAFYGIGAYVFGIMLSATYPIALCFAGAGAIAVSIAVILSFPLFRLRGDYFAFATLALLPLAELLGYNLTAFTGGADGLVLPPDYVLTPAFLLATGLALLSMLMTISLSRSRFGFALKSIRNDEQAAEVVGIRIFTAKLKVLSLSALFASLAGAIQTWQFSYIDPPSVFGLHVGLAPVAMALLGGSGLLFGPIVGVVFLTCLHQILLINQSILQASVYGLVMLLIGRFMPAGLLRAKFLRKIPTLAKLISESPQVIRSISTDGATKLPLELRTPDRSKPLLTLDNVKMAFGGNVAVNNVTMTIYEGEVIGLVGANGSGKTTLFNCISKVLEPSGRITFGGLDLSHYRRDEVCHVGLGRTFQTPRPFSDLTVAENIAIAIAFRKDAVGLDAAFHDCIGFANFVGLGERMNTRADALSLQERKSLELARALAMKPKLLLIDEVASGLTPTEVNRFVEHIRELRDAYGITVIWIEHIFSALAQVVDRLVVLEQGEVIANGPLADVVQDPRVLESYLGSSTEVLA